MTQSISRAYWRKVFFFAVMGVIGVVVLWTVGFLMMFGFNAQRAYTTFHEFERSRYTNIAEIEREMVKLETYVSHMKRNLSYVSFISIIPLIGEEYRAVENFINSSEILLQAGNIVISSLHEANIETIDVLSEMQKEASAVAVIDALSSKRDQLNTLALRAEEHAMINYTGSNIQSVDQYYRRIHSIIQRIVPIIKIGSALTLDHLDMLGFNGAKKYLVVFQNAQEIRPGGGLISMYGILDIEYATVTGLKTSHVTTLQYAGQRENYPLAPEPLRRFVDEQLFFHNSNWSAHPDVWARNAHELWRQGQPDKPVDGLVIIGTPLLEDLVGLFGPLKLKDVPVSLTSENVVEVIDWTVIEAQQKSEPSEAEQIVLQSLVDELRRRIEHAEVEELLQIATMIQKRNDARDFWVHLPDESQSRSLGILSTYQGLPHTDGDEILLLDANLGSAKADAHMLRSVALTVDASDVNSSTGEAVVTYDYRTARPDARTWPYTGHVRLYLPILSKLNDFQGIQENITHDTELEREVYGSYIFINFGESHTITAYYDLAPHVRQGLENGTYSLTMRKQGGIEPSYSVAINLPSDWGEVEAVASEGEITIKQVSDGIVAQWEGTLMRDTEIVIKKK